MPIPLYHWWHEPRTLAKGQAHPKVQGILNTPSGFGSDARMTRGLEISKRSTITESEDGSFAVPSQTREGFTYTVKAFGQEWTCDCPDFVNRCDAIEACKHIFAVKFWITARTELRNEPKPKVFAEDALQCGRCGSIRVIKYGINGTKQAYWCKDCAHKFTPSLLKKAKYTPEMITLTLDLYFGGLSLRKISRTVNDHFGTSLNAVTIYRWIQRYIPRISEYVGSLTPQLSDTWHADELFVKMKGGEKETQYNQKNMAYLWNIMDRKTRFLLASRLSGKRDEPSALAAFTRAVRVAHGSEPEKVFTDAFKSYEQGVREAFDNKPQHIAKAGIGKPHANNNRMERLNGTLRERVKVQRGWKSMDTPLAEGARIQYNFVRPHQALAGQTPADVAGIGLDSKDKWMELLKRALE
jgi:transposase-like protein